MADCMLQRLTDWRGLSASPPAATTVTVRGGATGVMASFRKKRKVDFGGRLRSVIQLNDQDGLKALLMEKPHLFSDQAALFADGETALHLCAR